MAELSGRSEAEGEADHEDIPAQEHHEVPIQQQKLKRHHENPFQTVRFWAKAHLTMGMFHEQTLAVSSILALSFYSMLGDFIRIFLSNLLGNACHSPGTVGWNRSQWAPCVTAPGNTASTGGGLFSDLPANMLGCFIMGLLVSGHDETLELPAYTNVACLQRQHWFQSWTTTHMALRTGFCGTLTTFSSWNAQMVLMICAGKGTELGTQWVSALAGYLIGWMVALNSYYVGVHVALMVHRYMNPDLAQEADMLKERRQHLVNRDLPDLERRYLYDLNDEEEEDGYASESGFHHLQRWKEGTHRHRHGLVEGGSFLNELHEIERLVLIHETDIAEELLEVARNAGWNVTDLQQWQHSRHEQAPPGVPWRPKHHEDYPTLNPDENLFNACALFTATGFLIWGVVAIDGSDSFSIHYRTSFLSSLFTPFGTVIRWRLSSLNGRIRHHNWHWLPIGTFVTNMMACCVSSLILALLSWINEPSDIVVVVLNAIKTGFAGSLSTVSTFIVELAALLHHVPQDARGYYYLILTLGVGCILGVACYVWAVV